MLTTYINVNFNKKVETLIFSTAVYIHSIYIQYTSINKLSKAVTAPVNTISS